MGQFRSIKNASPVIGRLDKLETIKEYKVEMICTNDYLNSVISAMKFAHSYKVSSLHCY